MSFFLNPLPHHILRNQHPLRNRLAVPPRGRRGRLWKFLIFLLALIVAYLIYIVTLVTSLRASGQSATPSKSSVPSPLSFKWIKDGTYSEDDNWKLHLYSGLVTFDRMVTLCSRLSSDLTDPPLLFINSAEGEKRMDDLIRSSADEIFGSTSNTSRRLLWTGMYFYSFSNGLWLNSFQKYANGSYTNFCNPGWEGELNGYKNDPNSKVFVVKDFRGPKSDRAGTDPACWQLLESRQMAGLTDQWPISEKGQLPRLNFACVSKNATTGQAAERVTGPRIANGSFILYSVPAIFEDAFAECQAHGAHLATYSTEEKSLQLQQFLRDSMDLRRAPLNNKAPIFWTGLDINVISAGPDFQQPRSLCSLAHEEESPPGTGWCNRRISGLKICYAKYCKVAYNLLLNAVIEEPDVNPRSIHLVVVFEEGAFCWIPLSKPFPYLLKDKNPEFFIVCERD